MCIYLMIQDRTRLEVMVVAMGSSAQAVDVLIFARSAVTTTLKMSLSGPTGWPRA